MARPERLSDFAWTAIAFAIVVFGVLGFVLLGKLKTPLEPVAVERSIPRVETMALARWREPLPIRGQGFIKPVRRVSIAAQAPGQIVELHPAMLSRGGVRTGEVLVRLDRRRAEAALGRSIADIEATRAQLELNATQLARAEKLREQRVISQEELDQRLAEKARLSATLSSLESARVSAGIALENTEVKAPFDGTILSRSAEVGAVVAAGQSIAELASVDALEVTVPLPGRDAGLIPRLFDGAKTPATVTTTFADSTVRYSAVLSRVARQLNSGTRMLDVTVALQPVGDASVRLPLIEAYADVELEGQRLANAYAVPATALREGETVWLAVDDTFVIQSVDVIHIDRDTAFVSLDRPPGVVRLITGVVDTPVDGMGITVDATR